MTMRACRGTAVRHVRGVGVDRTPIAPEQITAPISAGARGSSGWRNGRESDHESVVSRRGGQFDSRGSRVWQRIVDAVLTISASAFTSMSMIWSHCRHLYVGLVRRALILWQVFLPQAGHGTRTGKSIGSNTSARSREPSPIGPTHFSGTGIGHVASGLTRKRPCRRQR